jgi:hypothetical protein
MKPPVFISTLMDGNVVGHVRADQIAALFDVTVLAHAAVLDASRQPVSPCTQIVLRSGGKLYTQETLAQVFAKMADALHLSSEP